MRRHPGTYRESQLVDFDAIVWSNTKRVVIRHAFPTFAIRAVDVAFSVILGPKFISVVNVWMILAHNLFVFFGL